MDTEKKYQTETWKELKDFCNSLNEEQLKRKLVIEVAESPYKTRVHAYVADEDYLCNINDYEDQGGRGDMENCEGFDEDDYEIVNPKDSPVLSCDN